MRCRESCSNEITTVTQWQTTEMGSPAFWYECAHHAEATAEYFGASGTRVKWSQRLLSDADRTRLNKDRADCGETIDPVRGHPVDCHYCKIARGAI